MYLRYSNEYAKAILHRLFYLEYLEFDHEAFRAAGQYTSLPRLKKSLLKLLQRCEASLRQWLVVFVVGKG